MTAPDGVDISFTALLNAGTVDQAFYRASSCATLIAYAEVLGEIVCGRGVREAMELSLDDLVAALPGVPRQRQDRAILALRAWWSGLARAVEAQNHTGAQP